MLAWKLKWALNGVRLDFQVNIVSGVCFCAGRQTPPRARARPRWEFCIAHKRKVAMMAWELK